MSSKYLTKPGLLRQLGEYNSLNKSEKEILWFSAVYRGYINILDILLHKNEQDPNIVNSEGKNALHIVQDPQTAEYLIQQGVYLNKKDNLGKKPLATQREKKQNEVLEIIINHYNLLVNVNNASLELVEESLSEKGVCVNAKFENGKSYIDHFLDEITKGEINDSKKIKNIATKLVYAGAQYNIQNDNSKKNKNFQQAIAVIADAYKKIDDFHEAIYEGLTSKVKTIVEEDPDIVSAKDKDGWSSIFFLPGSKFTIKEKKELLKFLNAVHKDLIHTKDNDGLKISHWSGKIGDLELLELLVKDYGLDVNDVDNRGLNPFDHAITANIKPENMLNLFDSFSIYTKHTYICYYASEEDLNNFKKLLERTIKNMKQEDVKTFLDKKDESGYSIIHWVKGNDCLYELLIKMKDHGANINIEDPHVNKALDFLNADDPNVAELLKKFRASANMKGDNGYNSENSTIKNILPFKKRAIEQSDKVSKSPKLTRVR